MSQSYTNPTTQTLEAIRNDDDVREDIETLAERNDQYGALARVILAIADGETIPPADCREAGVESILKLRRSDEEW